MSSFMAVDDHRERTGKLLAEVGAVLAEHLECQAMLAHLVRLVARRLESTCVVHWRAAGGSLRYVTSAVDASKSSPPEGLITRTLTASETVFERGWVGVPLRSGRETLGALMLESPPPRDRVSLASLEELGLRIGLAVNHAALAEARSSYEIRIREREEAIARAAHDLRSVVGAMGLWLDVLRSGSEAETGKALKGLRAGLVEQVRLIDSLTVAQDRDVRRSA
jgi:signal transduction histidine kinase